MAGRLRGLNARPGKIADHVLADGRRAGINRKDGTLAGSCVPGNGHRFTPGNRNFSFTCL